MAWSITLNGTTYTDADFTGYNVFTKLPAMLADAVADFAAKVTAASGSVTSAGSSATNAHDSELAAAASAESALSHQNAAQLSETNAHDSELAAANSAASAAAVTGIPPVTPADAGKVMAVNAAGTAYTLARPGFSASAYFFSS